MIKTEFYIAGGESGYSTKIFECTKLYELEGILYDPNERNETWVKEIGAEKHNEKRILRTQDLITPDGITRRIILNRF